MAYLGVNTEEYERTAGGGDGHLPAGFYSGIVTRAEIRNNSERAKDPNGKYLEVEFDISAPQQFGNRKFWDKFNTINANAGAVRIGKEHLSDLAKALGISGTLNDSDELLGRECCFYLEVRPAKDNFQASNQCKKYLPSGSTEEDYKAWLAGSKRGGATQAAERPKWGGSEQAAPAQAEKPKPAWKK